MLIRTQFDHALSRLIAEPAFRAQLVAEPRAALAGYDLSDAQRALLTGLTPERVHWIVGSFLTHLLVPLRAAGRFVMLPAGSAASLAPGELPITLGAEWTFGTGTHPTTQLCLLALERLLQPGQRVLDVGTGSGVLSIAAARLGAARVLALDIEPTIAAVAQSNVDLNDVGGVVTVQTGSVEAALDRVARGLDQPPDLALANLLTAPLLAVLDAGLPRLLRPGGRLVVSGFQTPEAGLVRTALAAHGLAIAEEQQQSSWMGFVGQFDISE